MQTPAVGYTLIFVLALIWIAFGLYMARGGKKTFVTYAVADRRVGLAFGTATLLASWITANTILAAPQVAYNLGFLGVLGYCAAGGLGVLLFTPLARRIKEYLPEGITVADYFRTRYDRKSYYLFLVFFFTLIFLNGAQMPIGAGTVLEIMFGIDYHWLSF